MSIRPRQPQTDDESGKTQKPRRIDGQGERHRRVANELKSLSGIEILGRQVHPSEMWQPGDYLVAKARTGMMQIPAHRLLLLDSAGVKRTASIVREDHSARWLTIEGTQAYRPSFWHKDVYDLLLEAAPWTADTLVEAIEVLLLRYRVLAPTIVTTANLRRTQLSLDSAWARWDKLFMEPFGTICDGCETCAETPEWYVHRVYEEHHLE